MPPITVLSAPPDHVYVRHTLSEREGSVRQVLDVRRPSGLPDPHWLLEAEFDVLHLHAGLAALGWSDVEAVVSAVRERARPLVVTVHDLRDPHRHDPTDHDRQLDLLVPAADQLITLTTGAADEIRRRWRRETIVLPHPHVIDLRAIGVAQDARARRGTHEFRIGLDLEGLRDRVLARPVLEALIETVVDLPDTTLQVRVARQVMEHSAGAVGRPGAGPLSSAPELVDFLREQHRLGALQLQVHEAGDEATLRRFLGMLDALVLPYRYGSHASRLEACRDLGTTVLAPSGGYYDEQGPVLSFRLDERGLDARSLSDAVARAQRERPRLGADVAERRRQRQGVVVAHQLIYRSLTAGPT